MMFSVSYSMYAGHITGWLLRVVVEKGNAVIVEGYVKVWFCVNKWIA